MTEGDACSTNPTAALATEIKNLTNFGIQSTSDSEEVKTYDDSAGGWSAAVVTGNSYTVDCVLNIDMTDAGYKLLKKAALESATGTAVEWFRESPTPSGDCDSGLPITTPEYHSGVAYVTDFSEESQAGEVASVSFTLTGIGAYTWSEASTSG